MKFITRCRDLWRTKGAWGGKKGGEGREGLWATGLAPVGVEEQGQTPTRVRGPSTQPGPGVARRARVRCLCEGMRVVARVVLPTNSLIFLVFLLALMRNGL